MNEFKKDHIAPCGMNCRLCMAYQREKKPCKGCRGDDKYKPNHCVKCYMKTCSNTKNNKYSYCYECDEFPCKKLKYLDSRYKLKYHMSMIENLNKIKEKGEKTFLAQEEKRWICKNCKSIICVHYEDCPACKKNIEFQDSN